MASYHVYEMVHGKWYFVRSFMRVQEALEFASRLSGKTKIKTTA